MDQVPDGTVTVVVDGPTRAATLLLPADDHITLIVQRTGTYYEDELLRAIRERGRAGVYVDVGAHYGNHSVFFGLECAATSLICVEPNPATYDGLLANLEINGLLERATAHNVAIHPTWRHVDVRVPEWVPDEDAPARTNTGMSRVEEAAGSSGGIAAMPLDELLADWADVAVIKIDVEGDAMGVIESARRTIERHRPVLVVETFSDEEQRRLDDLLLPLAYEAHGPYSWTPTWIWAAEPAAAGAA